MNPPVWLEIVAAANFFILSMWALMYQVKIHTGSHSEGANYVTVTPLQIHEEWNKTFPYDTL